MTGVRPARLVLEGITELSRPLRGLLPSLLLLSVLGFDALVASLSTVWEVSSVAPWTP